MTTSETNRTNETGYDTPGEQGIRAARADAKAAQAAEAKTLHWAGRMGCVHEEVNVDIGTNNAGERVVAVDFVYRRATHPVATTMILSTDAAITLRNLLDATLAAAGIDDGDDDEPTGLAAADSYDLLRFAKAYASLGDAVTAQIDDLLAGRYDDVNGNAIDLIRDRLQGMNQELDDALAGYYEQTEDDEDEDDDHDEEPHVDRCPRCGNPDHDTLIWQDDGKTVQCTNCGTRFQP